MTRLDKADLVALVISAFRLSGWQSLVLADGSPTPLRLLRNGATPIEACLYIWNLTEGGRNASRPRERRIQATGIGDAFETSSRRRTLILGWSAEFSVFAAFDHHYHNRVFGSSPSLQIDSNALESAARHGIGVHGKKTGELALGIRPDMLSLYVEQMRILHSAGTNRDERDILERMAIDPLKVTPNELVAHVPASRRRIMTSTLRLLRDRRFSENVLSAYKHRCAFCEIQLNLLDAAHILPVPHPLSSDLVTNGVALCALHHRSYDSAIINFDANYSINLSNSAIRHLEETKRADGLARFKAGLRSTLHLPTSAANHPSIEMIVRANQLRGWV
ncbi:HNH endonuclease [Sphingobium yanoikuyae]|uniref:HNH endonuclease n=1 Tax=Sphingobium yanoikuyae TaxID=13690 RepID=UPI0026EC4BC1|nr:HNH endonuclease [Sphingobium yanoikuyae]